MLPELAAGGNPALAALERAWQMRQPFPLVLLDAHMPDLDGFEVARRIRERPELAGATIMMLTSDTQKGDAARCRELGIAAYLVKPITQSDLQEAILAALGEKVPPAEVPASYEAPAQPTKALRILLAEDNPVNQELAVRLLQKRGHTVVVCNSGRQAVEKMEAAEFQGFDVVLMDVQMPELNGWEATAAIRSREAAYGVHTPIIAMTAHALKGDQERCLAAGMDGYVSKPIRTDSLFEEIDRCISGASATPIEQTQENSDHQAAPLEPETQLQEVLHRAALLERMEGDRALLAEMVALFFEESPRQVAELREALARGDAAAAERVAHKLKGAVSNFAAPAAAAVAGQVEKYARAGDLSRVRKVVRSLERELERLRPVLTAFCSEVSQ